MGIARRIMVRGLGLLGLGAVVLSGCQTYPAGFGGMTLPSPQYLKHYPQYFPPDPGFPLQRELDSMQDQDLFQKKGGAAVAPLAVPGAVPPPAPAPAPVPK